MLESALLLNLIFLFFGWFIPSPAAWVWKHIYKRLVDSDETKKIAYDHYKLRAMKHGHQTKTPIECKDGDCIKIG